MVIECIWLCIVTDSSDLNFGKYKLVLFKQPKYVPPILRKAKMASNRSKPDLWVWFLHIIHLFYGPRCHQSVLWPHKHGSSRTTTTGLPVGCESKFNHTDKKKKQLCPTKLTRSLYVDCTHQISLVIRSNLPSTQRKIV